MLTDAARDAITTYVRRWIAQFENSALLEIRFLTPSMVLTDAVLEIEDRVSIVMRFRVPTHSQGSVFTVLVRDIKPADAMEWVVRACREQQVAYFAQKDVHDNLKFTPMEDTTDGTNEN